ncbi:KdsC family phosphatase [Avrilella dinanensis]|uniref:3-deoxy-D-manno-octulosonate 8-phosphate phosphatase n=1 Tax=Avrilella dinanensis TaxID=2008672 RepID=A0A2M9R2K1_9FLAO|nr:HAD-IIIA family hydrolase [Avrilella dinanensis]PJR03087.1 3-deoxy-D-manno-octulosonate 8-phosphate phosphatase [Avrilella dinanensis]
MAESYKEIMNNINTFIFDVDGVLTDGKLHISNDGELLRQMHVKDGYALKAAIDKNFRVCIISGGKNDGVRERLKNLGITDIYLGIPHKMDIFKEYINKHNIDSQHILYMGDDIPDYWVMKEVGLPTCPQDAVPEIKTICRYISHKNGGNGAVRDVIEQVLKVQNKWLRTYDATL